eukprot:jgi/Tetstr1/436600/TSEL_025397.t1
MSGAGSSLPPPLAAAAQGLTALRGGLEGGLAGLAAGLGGLRDGLARAASEVQRRQAAMQLQHLLQHPPPPPAARLPDPGFASLSVSSWSRRAPQPVMADLAMHPGEVSARLRGLTVYTVVNNKNEFVLVSGEGTGAPRQLGLFFFSEEDAKSLVSKIQEQNPKLGKQAQILPVGMDQVYKFAISPRQKELQGATFRFMPDMKQVKQAVELYQEAGLNVDSFVGVPVFQVEGLNVKTEKTRYTPLFLSKADLDSAVGNAAEEREAKATQAAAQKHQKAQEEVERLQQELAEVEDGSDRARRRAEGALKKAEDRSAKALAKLQQLRAKSQPKVEVGSLEEVLLNMEADKKDAWGDVMFIPPGSLTAAGNIQAP